MPKKTIKDPVLTSLTNLEESNTEDTEENDEKEEEIVETIQAVKSNSDSRPLGLKKERTPKQIETFEKARITREANIKKKKEEAERIAIEEKKIKEEKLIKKAVAVRKKQLKREELLNELSDDETPVQKDKEVVKKVVPVIPKEEKPMKPVIKFF